MSRKTHHPIGTLLQPSCMIQSRYNNSVTNKTLLLTGAHDRTKLEDNRQYFEISQLYIHKQYQTSSGYGHYIALIRLSKPAVLNSAVGLVCLPRQDNRVAVGKMCWLTGNAAFSSIGLTPQFPNSDRARPIVETRVNILV